MFTEGVTTGLAMDEVKPAGTDVQLYVKFPVPPLALASSCTLAPTQIVEGVACGFTLNDPPLTFTVTLSEAEHPVEFILAVKVKVVVDKRLTVTGSSTVALTSEEAGVQLYVKGPVPVTVPFSVVFVPYVMVTSFPALTTGGGLTVTTAGFDGGLRHPLGLVILTV